MADQNMELKRSSTPAITKMIGVSIIGLLLFSLITRILRAINNFVPWDFTDFVDLIRALVILIIIVAVAMIWTRSKKGSYTITDTAIIVKYGGMFGGKSQKIYNFKNISSLDLDQSFLAARLNYGDIVVHMDRYASNEVLRLTNIDHPDDYMKQLHIRSVNSDTK